MNLGNFMDSMLAFAQLTEAEQQALYEFVQSTPISITDDEALLLQKGVELVLKPAETTTSGVAPLNTEITTAIASYDSLGGALVQVGVTVLINLKDWPPIGDGPQTAQVVWETDMDGLFPGGWSHALTANPLFSDGLSDTWDEVELDNTIVTDLQGDGQWVIWEGTLQFNTDGTEDTTFTTTAPGEFRSVTASDIYLFNVL